MQRVHPLHIVHAVEHGLVQQHRIEAGYDLDLAGADLSLDLPQQLGAGLVGRIGKQAEGEPVIGRVGQWITAETGEQAEEAVWYAAVDGLHDLTRP